jgi:O-methyltransferase
MSYFERFVRRAPKPLRPLIQNLKLRLVGAPSLVPERELEQAYRRALTLLKKRNGLIGDYLEFGVYTGTSLVCMHRAATAVAADEIRLFGFDSFEGLPDEAAHDDGGHVWWPRQFAASRELAERTLREHGVERDRVVLVPGWFAETLTEETKQAHALERAGVVMIDCDMYSSAKEALAFCEPLIRDEAILFFEDWHSAGLGEAGLGERRAFEEFLREHPDLATEELEPYAPSARVFLVRRERAA